MAKKISVDKAQTSLTNSALSLFDRENLESLDALRYKISRDPVTTPAASPKNDSIGTNTSDADHVFDQCKIDDNDENWGMGELNVKNHPPRQNQDQPE